MFSIDEVLITYKVFYSFKNFKLSDDHHMQQIMLFFTVHLAAMPSWLVEIERTKLIN